MHNWSVLTFLLSTNMCSFPLKLCCNARMYFMWFFQRSSMDIRLHTELWKQCPTWACHPLNYTLDQVSLIKYHWSLVSRILHENVTIQVYYASRFNLGSIIVVLNCTFFTLYGFEVFFKQFLILTSPKIRFHFTNLNFFKTVGSWNYLRDLIFSPVIFNQQMDLVDLLWLFLSTADPVPFVEPGSMTSDHCNVSNIVWIGCLTIFIKSSIHSILYNCKMYLAWRELLHKYTFG